MQKGGHGIVSELKPVGPERDKQIAELRGEYKCMHDMRPRGLPPEANIADMCEKNSICWPTHCFEGVCLIWKVKPYSTDISCAMELWEEMIESELQFYIDANKTHSSVWMLDEGIGDRIMLNEVVPYNLADAISGAYLKWKSHE
jgi:hypothetical protein